MVYYISISMQFSDSTKHQLYLEVSFDYRY